MYEREKFNDLSTRQEGFSGRDVDQRVTAFAYDDAWPVTYSREGGQTLTIQTAGHDIIAFTAWYSVNFRQKRLSH